MRNLPPLLVALVALVPFILTGCQSDETVPDLTVEALYFEPIGTGYRAQVSDTTELVFRTREEWESFLPVLEPMAAFADSDFEQTMIVVAVVPAFSGGYTVEFEAIEEIGEEVVATYGVGEPGFDCVAISALTQPFQVVAVRRSDKPVRFVRHSRPETCSSR